MQHDKKTQKVKVDMTLDEAKPDDFDAVLLPGGAMNADALRMEKKAQEFVKNIDRAGKPIAVICHGPWLLISAGLVKGRHMTSYKTIQDDLKNAGAKWVDEVCVRDRNWVSSRQPSDIPEFNEPDRAVRGSETERRRVQRSHIRCALSIARRASALALHGAV